MRHFIQTFAIAALILTGGFTGVSTGSATSFKTPREARKIHTTLPLSETRVRYKMRNSNDVVMYLGGTTPVKNWKMSAHGLTGDGQFVLGQNEQLLSIDALSFSLPVHNLKGDEEAMEEDAYKALKADRYKEITFVLGSAEVESSGERLYVIKALGTLTVAGVTRAVTLIMHSRIMSDGSISFRGSQSLRMSDYNVERPSAFFGIIRADDEMTLAYNLVFSN